MSRAPEFIALSDAAVRAVAGTNSRHVALIEDAFGVLVETPGGGVSLAALHAFTADPNFGAAMQRAGVASAPRIEIFQSV